MAQTIPRVSTARLAALSPSEQRGLRWSVIVLSMPMQWCIGTATGEDNMERANLNETSTELTMDELDSVAGGMDTTTKVFAAACLLNTSFMLGAIVAMAVMKQ